MTELRADFGIFKEPAFVLTVVLGCLLLICVGGVIWYVQT